MPFTTVRDAVNEYSSLGFDTLPLKAGSKDPIPAGWQRRKPYRMWQDVPQNANLGLRAGGDSHSAFIDCDEKTQAGTFQTAVCWLAGLGINPGAYPVIATPSGGQHIYIDFLNDLPGDARRLTSHFGAGEFRYGSGAYVVAPPSQVNNFTYSLIEGDYRQLPRLKLADVLPILENQDLTPVQAMRRIPRLAIALLNGRGVDWYSSRSEAEQAILVSLVNAGFSFFEVLELFNRNPCAGKYNEMRTKNARIAERWLSHSYNEATQWAATHESSARQTAQAIIDWAESKPWPGRTGAIDRLVLIAHAEIAYRAGRLNYAAACRDIAERAAVNRMTASRATNRLCKAGLLDLHTNATVDCANIYHLSALDKVGHSPSTSIVRKCHSMSNTHDIFRYRGLGKAAGEVWEILQENPVTIEVLAERTGRHVKTIKRVLGRMAKIIDTMTGEVLAMASTGDGVTYYALPVDLDHIARIIGTAGAGQRQRESHAKERRLHARGLSLGKTG